MKLRWHVLLSVTLAGLGFMAATALHLTQAVAFGVAGFVFVLYWLVVVFRGDVELPDIGDF